MKTNKRLPRPTGITLLIRENRLKEAQDQILTQWVTNNFTLCQQVYSIPDVARMLKLNPHQVIANITKPLKTWLLQGKQEENYQALVSLFLNFALSDRSQIQGEVEVIRRRTKGRYQPFITQTLLNAYAMLNISTKNLMEFAKQFKPDVAASKSLDQPLANPQGSTQGSKFLGTVEAVKLIEANRSENLLDGGTLQSQILTKEKLENLPEVVATKQQGLDSTGLEKKVKKRIHNTDADPNIKDAIIIP